MRGRESALQEAIDPHVVLVRRHPTVCTSRQRRPGTTFSGSGMNSAVLARAARRQLRGRLAPDAPAISSAPTNRWTPLGRHPGLQRLLDATAHDSTAQIDRWVAQKHQIVTAKSLKMGIGSAMPVKTDLSGELPRCCYQNRR
jgi:hypothetical protein